MTATLALLALGLLVRAPFEPVPLHAGCNDLLDIGRYEVAYQRGGGEWQSMPLGWSGQFEPGIGVARVDLGMDRGRRALLLHCPWMNGTGPVELRYRLAVPDAKPVTLRFSYGMSPNNTAKSDGVTFTVRADGEQAGGETKPILSLHTRSTEWTDVEADLSGFAGKVLVLVFGAGPGPANDPSFDFSLYGSPEVWVAARPGEGGTKASAATVREVRSRWDAHRPSALDMANRSDQGVVPSTAGRYRNSVHPTTDGFELTYDGDDCRLRYLIPRGRGLPGLEARVNDLPPIPLDGGGLFPAAFALTKAADGNADLALAGGGAELVGTGEVAVQPKPCRVRYGLRIKGKALVLGVEGLDGGAVSSFTAPQPGAVAWRRSVSVPYLVTGGTWYFPDTGLFASAQLDWTASSASSQAGSTAHYDALSDGARVPLRETAVVTVSPYVEEVLPNIPNPPSPFLADLAKRVVVDDWFGSFAHTDEAARALRAHGVRDCLVQVHAWQNAGYDVKLPDVLPANAGCGGDEGLVRLSETCRRLGYLFGVHENYVDLYPDAPSWDASAVALNADGSRVLAWFNPGTNVRSFGYRADAIVPMAEKFTPEVHRRYSTTCSYLDVHSAVPPWFHVDFTAGKPGAGEFAPVLQAHERLWEYFRDVHKGPVLGEGNCHMFWAGRLDGVEAQVDRGEDHQVLPVFELLKVHPLMLNHGMGYYERWLREGYDAGLQGMMPLLRADKYRSQEVLYGHAGFIGAAWLGQPLLAVKEAHMLAPIQSRYGDQKVASIEFLAGGEWVDTSTAVALGQTDVARITYANGLALTVNQSPDTIEADGRRVPQYGFVAHGAGIEAAYIAEVDGQVVDFVRDDASVFVDARGLAYRPDLEIVPLRPEATEAKPTAARTFDITYHWTTEASLAGKVAEGTVCFVHFTNAEVAGRPDGIVFQDDHPFPAEALAPGEHSVGPRTVHVPPTAPAGDYQVLLGLFSPRGRSYLRGKDEGGLRYRVGVVHVAADGTVTFTPASPGAAGPDVLAIYDERANKQQKVVDFGPVRSDGAAKVVRGADGSLEVFPLPQGKPFTLEIRPERLGLAAPKLAADLIGGDGKVLRTVALSRDGGLVSLPIGGEGVCSLRVRPNGGL